MVMTLGAGSAIAKKGDGRPVEKVVLFASDGMRPDLMERYAKAGFMPTYQALMKDGATGRNGMLQTFPPNTGVGWYTMATGAYPAEHGSTNNTFFRQGDAFANRTSFSGAGVLQADTIANAAERAGKKVAQVDWVGGAAARIDGPTVDFANFFSTRGVLAAPLNATEQSGANAFGIAYQVASFAPGAGWTNVPAGDPAAPPMQTVLTVATTFAAQNPARLYDIYVYDSVVNGTAAYDHVILVPSAASKNGSQAAVNLAVGDFKEIKLTGADALIGARAGQTAGFYTKLISLAPNLSSFKLYFTSVERVIATCSTPACNALPAGAPGENRLEKYLAEHFPTYIAADFAPLEARIIDEETYVQQGRDLEKAYSEGVLEYIVGVLQPDTDLAMVGFPVTDEFSHQFMALYTPTDIDGNQNPYYDDVEGDGIKDNRVAIREGYVRSAYHEADAKLALTRKLMGGNPTTFAGSDHGFAPQWEAVNARKVLFDKQISWTVPATTTTLAIPQTVSLHASGGNTASNCGGVAIALAPTSNAYASGDLTKACWAGGTIQVYVNATLPAGLGYDAVRNAVKDAFLALNAGGKRVVERVMMKEELRNVDGSDSLHPSRSGDVVIVLRPPYQSDAGTPGQAIAFSQFFGQHGYLPDLVDLAHNVNMHATFVAGGPLIKKKNEVKDLRAIDIAPTVAFLMDIPGPQNARGRILYDLVEGAESYSEVTILDISDYHGQLVPLTEAADNLAAPAINPTYTIGGSAFLKPWFQTYEAEAALSKSAGVIELAAGDSVGATPPISSFFGDTPTIELMNLMGIDIDGIGNHNFDRGQAYFRNTLIPLAKYPFVSANVVDASGKTPAEWSPSHVFELDRGVKLGIVGFSNDDLPELINPVGLLPFHVENSTAAVNAEAAKLVGTTDATVAIGHLGATDGTLTAPTGPVVDLADHVANVAAVIGDHTNFQVLTTRPNGVLLTENLSKGVRFTRVRLVIGQGKTGVVYKTADFHKPWTIGVTPDPAIQARIDELNRRLTPILGAVIGTSTVEILRSDVCGRIDGRLCESLVGDVVTDAMRKKYEPIGVEFAITNSGGLRDRLTCPAAGGGTGLCPPSTPPPYVISRGQVLAVLPFGNIVVTLNVNGAELKTMLENGVGLMPSAQGRFPQVSGLCFTYNVEAPAGSRVTGAVRQAADGTCTGAPVDLTAGSAYKIAENDFMANGGDGYPFFTPRVTTQDIMDQVVADHITATSPIAPAIQGRIKCVDPNPGAGNNCPAGSP